MKSENDIEMPKNFEFKQRETELYKKWEESGCFNPDNLTGEPYSNMMPPPNVTGVLHLGHALENTIMDVNIRYQRMIGKKALLLPGTDHAAIATQAKVEKLLIAQGIKNPREELGREELLERIKEFAEGSKETILTQIRKMGTSCDWSRLAYTFDEQRNKTVNEVFVKMYNDGLIYRGYRAVNWSIKGQSTCSDDELEYIERPAKIYTFKYSKDFPIAIATTRPETKLGDTAVAVNPNDERYQEYIGQVFTVDVGAANPLEVKIIASLDVDMEFGTGALGVTPAHSTVDYDMYLKQKANGDAIGIIPVIGIDGRMTAEAGASYVGLTTDEARQKFVEWLRANDLMIAEEDIVQNVSVSDRFKDVVEVIPLTQWFVDANKKIAGRDKSLKDLMREAMTIGHSGDKAQKISITPERFENSYLRWIDNLRDWCISRQIWWGHRIPVWYRVNSDLAETLNSNSNLSASSVVGRAASHVCSVDNPGLKDNTEDRWIQETDTLDTWFSSGMWSFSTLDKGDDLQTFHPTSWMQMGYEILFFWMARMILMTTYFKNQIPFREVYIHGMLRDEKGNKFSKSSGNNIDPLDVIEKYGCDALRLSLMLGVTPGGDQKFYDEKVEGAKNFVNKLWNVAKYALANFQFSSPAADNFQLRRNELTNADLWILEKMRVLIVDVTEDLNVYRFSQAAEKLREFTWNDLADWYLEVSKFEKNEAKGVVLNMILKDVLKLWHPFIPFVSEEIWSQLKNEKMLIVSAWPKATDYQVDGGSTEKKGGFELTKEIVSAIRNARAENKVEPARKVKAVILAGVKKELIESQAVLIKSLRTGIDELIITEQGNEPSGAIFVSVDDIKIYLLGAVDAEKERARLTKEITDKEKLVAGLESRLSNEEFAAKAPAVLVEKERVRLAELKEEVRSLKERVL